MNARRSGASLVRSGLRVRQDASVSASVASTRNGTSRPTRSRNSPNRYGARYGSSQRPTPLSSRRPARAAVALEEPATRMGHRSSWKVFSQRSQSRGVRQLVQEDEGGFVRIGVAVTNEGDQGPQVQLQQQRMIEPQPPDAARRDARAEQPAHRLVEAGGLPDPARPEHELEPARVRGLQTSGEERREAPFDRRRPGRRHFAVAVPGVLLDEDLRVVSDARRPGAPAPIRRRSLPRHPDSTRGRASVCAVSRIACSL